MGFDLTEFPKVLTLYLSLSQYPILAPQVREAMRRELFKRGVITPEAFEAEAREKAIQSQRREGLLDPTQRESQADWEQRLRIVRDNLTDFYFAYNLPHERFETILRDILASRIPEGDVVLTIHPELAPWDMLFAQGEQYEALAPEERKRIEHHLMEIKVVLIKAMISDHLAYLAIAKDWFDVSDLKAIREHRIGRGKIGGKAAGVMLAECVMRKSAPDDLLEHFNIPSSWFLGADVFYQFTQYNRLFDYANQKYKQEAEIRRDYPEIQRAFAAGRFPRAIREGLAALLDSTGQKPLIVRSSSLLEDSFGTSFAGKYESIFLPNQGTAEANLEQLLAAVRRVYASVYAPDALLYRRQVGLTDYDERMAILIQEAIGRKSNGFYLPDAAGVAFSRNQFRWSPRIERKAGFLRLVWGFGTRAVEQVVGDYPRLVALSHPTLRPEGSSREVRQHSQSKVDLIDLETNAFRTLPAADVLNAHTPHLRLLAQVHEGDELRDIVSNPLHLDPDTLALTFERLLRDTPFPRLMRRLLAHLEQAYRSPVDTEFALLLQQDEAGHIVPQIYLVQCRPQSHLQAKKAPIPQDIPKDQRLFVTRRMVPDGSVSAIRYVVYVDPQVYGALQTATEKTQAARLIGRINRALADQTFILIGPGRWGSNNPELGLPVTYGDIYHARAIIELAADERWPEPSYGTHFFQDLVEAHIFPLALALQDPGAELNMDFMEGAQNRLRDLLPEAAQNAYGVHVIDIPGEKEGDFAELVMDGDQGVAVAYFQSQSKEPPSR